MSLYLPSTSWYVEFMAIYIDSSSDTRAEVQWRQEHTFRVLSGMTPPGLAVSASASQEFEMTGTPETQTMWGPLRFIAETMHGDCQAYLVSGQFQRVDLLLRHRQASTTTKVLRIDGGLV